MCGIAAIFAYTPEAPPVSAETLLRLREAMSARGPDGASLWLSDNHRIGLAHRRLAILDLSEAGAQPMATPDGALRITFNGEIYNFQELRHKLEAKGYRFHSTSDTEVLLYLARDPFGIKPLYYADDGATIQVASQVKALLKGGSVETTPEPAGHVGFFLWGHVPEPYTLYKRIRAVPAGSTLWVDASGQQSPRPFFSLTGELARASERGPEIGPHEIQERLRTALTDSVQHHLIADVPVGVFLSSGLDSSTLAALAAEIGGNLRTVTLGFREYQGTEDDEVPLAELVAQRYGAAHQTRWVTKQDFQDQLPHFIKAMDQPTIDGVNSYFVSKAAAETGLKVALSGLGGDELFGGYPSFWQIPRLVRMLRPLESIPVLGKAFRYVSAPLLKHFTSPKYAGLVKYGGSYGGAYLLRRGLFMPWELPEVLDPDVVREGWRTLQPLARLDETVNGIKNDKLKIFALEMNWYIGNQLLRDVNWASMAHSLEIRVPLVDAMLFRAMLPLISLQAISKRGMAHVLKHSLPDQLGSTALNRGRQ